MKVYTFDKAAIREVYYNAPDTYRIEHLYKDNKFVLFRFGSRLEIVYKFSVPDNVDSYSKFDNLPRHIKKEVAKHEL